MAIAFTLIAIDPPAQSPIATLSGPAKSQRYRDGHGGPNRPIVRDVYFDDDGPGEIADVVAIRLTENLVSVTLFHCKFSSGDMPGARVKDLYAVRGQAQKSARWRDRPNRMFQHMLRREKLRLDRGLPSRFERGTAALVKRLKASWQEYRYEYAVRIVQPGLGSGQS